MGAFLLGVTGAIGAGKSTVCGVLAAHGWSVLDLDAVAAAALVAQLPIVAQHLPMVSSASGALDKEALFAEVLCHPGRRAQLTDLLRPDVMQRIRAWAEGLDGCGALDAALLFEQGLDSFCQATLCVVCDHAERRQRVARRSTASARHLEALEAAQWPEATKRARAQVVVSTDGSADQLPARLRAALRTLNRSL